MSQVEAGLSYDLTNMHTRTMACDPFYDVNDVPFGVAVCVTPQSSATDDNDHRCALPDLTGDYLKVAAVASPISQIIFSGVHHQTKVVKSDRVELAAPIGDGDTAYKVKTEAASIQTRGRIWVKVDEDVDAGELAYVRVTATGDQRIGQFCKTDDATTQQFTLQFGGVGVFYKGAVAGELAVLEMG